MSMFTYKKEYNGKIFSATLSDNPPITVRYVSNSGMLIGDVKIGGKLIGSDITAPNIDEFEDIVVVMLDHYLDDLIEQVTELESVVDKYRKN